MLVLIHLKVLRMVNLNLINNINTFKKKLKKSPKSIFLLWGDFWMAT